MKIEKITENKIRIFLDTKDFIKNDIDIQTFMSNPIKSQKFFIDILNEADKKVGFSIKDYKLYIELLESNNSYFILTITRNLIKTNIEDKSLKVKKKNNDLNKKTAIYTFENFNFFCDFCKYISSISALNSGLNQIKTYLYFYNKKYYFVVTNFNLSSVYIKTFFDIISEFAIFLNNSESFNLKLKEHGKTIFKANAITKCTSLF